MSLVLTLMWFPPSCGFHPAMALPSHGFHLPMVSTLLWFPPSCGFHLAIVSTLPWFLPFRGFHIVWLLRRLNPLMVYIFAWFPLSRGLPSVVCTFPWFTLCHEFPLSCGYSIISTFLWFASSCGFDPNVVTPWCSFCGLHHTMVYNLPWFPPSCGYSVVSSLNFGLN